MDAEKAETTRLARNVLRFMARPAEIQRTYIRMVGWPSKADEHIKATVAAIATEVQSILLAAEEAEGMRKALEFYADAYNWQMAGGIDEAPHMRIDEDGGAIARAAITPKPAADGSERQ